MERLTREQAKELGFKELPHFTVMGAMDYPLGRNRHLSLGCVGEPNEMLFIAETDENDSRNITNLICLHNFDYDGFLTKDKLAMLISAIGAT